MNKITVSLIDDSMVYQTLVKNMLTKVKYIQEVQQFINGKEALDHYASLNILPDLILLDIKMPIKNGWEFLEAFKAITQKADKKIVIYIVSSSISKYDHLKAKTYPEVYEYIVKPMTQKKLDQAITKAVELLTQED